MRLVRGLALALDCDAHAVLGAAFILGSACRVQHWPGATKALALGRDAWGEPGAEPAPPATAATSEEARESTASAKAIPQHWVAVAQAAVLLAGKATEQARRIRDILNATQYILAPESGLVALDTRYSLMKEAVVSCERTLLRSMAFDLRRIPDSPYEAASRLCKAGSPGRDILRGAFALISDGGLVLRQWMSDDGRPAASASAVAAAAVIASAVWSSRGVLPDDAGSLAPPSSPFSHPGIFGSIMLGPSAARLCSCFLALLCAPGAGGASL